jgi:signal transduction histidine kinase
MAEGQALSQRTDALDVIVELLGALDGEKGVASGREFYDRLCEACCRVASMERAGLLLYDDARQLVVPVGGHGLEPGLFAEVYGTLEETPIAQVALSEDRVVEVTGNLERWVPERYARLGGVETLTCVPVSAGGRWLGVIFSDRGGTRFELTDEERHAMWTLGKTAALAASVRIATNQQGRARLLQARIDLARELHERVVQRLFGVSLVLGSDHALSDEARQRCASETHAALADLRDALSRPLAPPSLDTGATLRGELARLGRHYKDLPLELDWEDGVEVPEDVEPLAQSVLAEALRNARKHARPSSVRVHVGRVDGTFVLEVRNDGAEPGTRGTGTGMGLRLAAFEALQRGALVEFGPERQDWRVRLVVPVEEDSPE